MCGVHTTTAGNKACIKAPAYPEDKKARGCMYTQCVCACVVVATGAAPVATRPAMGTHGHHVHTADLLPC